MPILKMQIKTRTTRCEKEIGNCLQWVQRTKMEIACKGLGRHREECPVLEMHSKKNDRRRIRKYKNQQE
jgi:hypothetical protein